MTSEDSMKERPILFSGAMVRALLAGTKTQTRRVVKITHRTPGLAACLAPPAGMRTRTSLAAELCPYGQPGDRLWVREAFAFTDAHEPSYIGSIEYRADGKCMAVDYGQVTVAAPHNCDPLRFDGPWKPSIHMPRWASRITLEVTGVRVELLQDISEADALAEGVNVHPVHHGKPRTNLFSPVQAYRDLWEQINGHGSWDRNPWVWVVEFKRLDNQ